MNGYEINNQLNKYKRFLGVFPADKIPKIVPIGYAFVVNLDPANRPGSHWVGVYKSVLYEYFDPLGKPPPSHLKLESPILFNKKKIQDVDSISCGKFAIDFVSRRLKGESFSSIQSSWTKNRILNDLLLLL